MSISTNFALFYVDDSGSETHGIATFSWIRIDPAHWAVANQRWLKFRVAIYRRHGIPADMRLHATELAGARGVWTRALTSGDRRQGLTIIEEGLTAIAGLPGTTLGSVYRRTSAKGRGFERDQQDLYQQMIMRLDTDLGQVAAYGAIVMDGDGTNAEYQRGHRKLDHSRRSLIEDPFFRHASASQWVQIADLAAWTAYRSLRPGGRSDRTATWYSRILQSIDADGEPTEL
jgi:hypothetical protein